MASRTASCRSSLGRSTSSRDASAPFGRAIFSVSGKRAARRGMSGTYRNLGGRAMGLTGARGNGMVRALRTTWIELLNDDRSIAPHDGFANTQGAGIGWECCGRRGLG